MSSQIECQKCGAAICQTCFGCSEEECTCREDEGHTHTCQQCDKVVTEECHCDTPVKNVWCSANCRAAFDL